ncbi:MAG: MMPL family transporter [Candidatus Methanoplasma sp.]|nr:MMPL family transporter [Candidatus Methanoplasma sp.]
MKIILGAMIFEKLADVISKRSKLIVAVWIVVLICAVPLALKAGSVLDYDTTDMAGPDAESLKGAEVMEKYFYKSDIPIESAVLLVAGFDTPEGKAHTFGIYDALSDKVPGYVDGDGSPKIAGVLTYGMFTADGDENRGVAVYAVIYSQKMIDGSKVSGDTPEFRNFVNGVLSENDISGVRTYVSGSPAISYDTEMTAAGDISKIDVFSILMILILVGLFFRSLVTSAMPPLTIGVAFGVTLCLMYLIGSVMNIVYMTEMLLLVSMLGAGCDYCIFILARYREERVSGSDHESALKKAVVWAGESITTSGLAVMIGFGAMSICSFSMISTMGIMLAVGIVVALLAALTLITSVLAIFGERLFWPTKAESLREGGKSKNGWYGRASNLGHAYFLKSARASIKYSKVIIVAAVLFTIPTAYIMATSESSYDMIGAMSSGEAIDGLDAVEEYSNGGMIMPDYAVLAVSESIGTVFETEPGEGMLHWSTDPAAQEYLSKLSALSSSLSEDDNVGEIWGIYQWNEMIKGIDAAGTEHDRTVQIYSQAAAKLPDTLGKQVSAVLEPVIAGYEMATGHEAVYSDPNLIATMDYMVNYRMAASVGGDKADAGTLWNLTYVKYTVITKEEAMSDRSMDTIKFVDLTMSDFADNNPDMVAAAWLTGSAVVMYEISGLVSSEFLKVEILAIALIFILLFFVMRSYVTPVRSILTILMSVVWTVAVTHLIFSNLFGDGVIWMIPIILIVVCLGLGMDYDILLTTRIRENRVHRGMSNDDAITHAVTHSGSVITICGLIMGGAFGTLMLSGTTMLQEFGFALCFAIIVDALLVRTYVVPAAMHLLGDWNWKGPKFLQRNESKPPE